MSILLWLYTCVARIAAIVVVVVAVARLVLAFFGSSTKIHSQKKGRRSQGPDPRREEHVKKLYRKEEAASRLGASVGVVVNFFFLGQNQSARARVPEHKPQNRGEGAGKNKKRDAQPARQRESKPSIWQCAQFRSSDMIHHHHQEHNHTDVLASAHARREKTEHGCVLRGKTKSKREDIKVQGSSAQV
jgi:hypothetical protein